MKKKLLIVLIFASLTLAQNCPPQPYPEIPTDVDMAKVAYDHDGTNPSRPAPKKLLLRPTIYNPLGNEVQVTGWACDPDGDVMQITAQKGTIILNATDKTWTLKYKPTAIGDEYFTVTVVDVRKTNDAMSTTGTLRVVTIPQNKPPIVGCGSQPTSP